MATKKPQGIGGWLLLPTIGLFLAALIYAFTFIVTGFALILGSLELLLPFLTSTIMGSLVIYTLVLEFKKKKQFVKWMIITLWATVATTLLLSMADGDYSTIGKITVSTVLWTWYFKVSKRVKNTFVK